MYGNGAGIGMALTKAVCKMIPGERLLAETAWYAVAVGSVSVRTFVLRFRAAAIPVAWVTILASGWCVPEFLRLRRARNGTPPSATAEGERVVRALRRRVRLLH